MEVTDGTTAADIVLQRIDSEVLRRFRVRSIAAGVIILRVSISNSCCPSIVPIL